MNFNLPKIKALVFYGSLLVSSYLAFTHQTNTLGKAALLLLTVVIFTKPFVRLFPTIGIFKSLLAVRRQLGQASAFAAFGHVAAQIFPGVSLSNLFRFGLEGNPQNFQFWGFWAFILLIPLFLTSNDFSTSLLKRNWFQLHKLIHPLYIFAMLHYGLREGYFGLIKSALILSALYFSRFLAARGVQFFAPSPPRAVI